MAASSQTNQNEGDSIQQNRIYNNRASGALIVASATSDISVVSDLPPYQKKINTKNIK